MEVGPPGSPCRRRSQTTASCCGQEPWWLALQSKRPQRNHTRCPRLTKCLYRLLNSSGARLAPVPRAMGDMPRADEALDPVDNEEQDRAENPEQHNGGEDARRL